MKPRNWEVKYVSDEGVHNTLTVFARNVEAEVKDHELVVAADAVLIRVHADRLLSVESLPIPAKEPHAEIQRG